MSLFQSRVRLPALAVLALVFGVFAPASPASAVDTPERLACFVQASHRVFLSRDATPAEVASWEERFADGGSRSQLPSALANSDEWLTVVVDGLYLQALDREPDAAGRAFWISQLRAGVLVNSVASRIYGSAEFYTRAGSTPDGFVTALYTRILHRTPDAAGSWYWQVKVAERGRGPVASLFFASVESRADRVTTLYRAILNREPDAAGRSYWIDQLRTVNDVRLATLLASSNEFYQRAQQTCGTKRITDGNEGSQEPELSDDGRYVTFTSTATDLVVGGTAPQANVYLWERSTGITTQVTDGDGWSFDPDISGDGRYITYSSHASNLVEGDTEGQMDVFTWDRLTDSTVRVTSGVYGGSDPAISGDGLSVTYESRVLGLGETSAQQDVFVWDRSAGTSTQVTEANSDSYEPSISGDGRYITFFSDASDLPEQTTSAPSVFVWDRSTATSTRVANGSDHWSFDPVISGDGRYIAFYSDASDLIVGETNERYNVYVWDRSDGVITKVTDGDRGSHQPDISADGRFISFWSYASDLVVGDSNGAADVFAWEISTGATTQITRGNLDSVGPSLSGDGRLVTYVSSATDLVPGDLNDQFDVFVTER